MAYYVPLTTQHGGRAWPNLDIVRGQCDDHLIPCNSWVDGPVEWESDRLRRTRQRPPALSLRGVPSGELEFMRASGFTPSCDLPSVSGLALYSVAGALATPRQRVKGALNGLWGGWVGCALSRALGAGDFTSTVLTLGGAYFVARTFRS